MQVPYVSVLVNEEPGPACRVLGGPAMGLAKQVDDFSIVECCDPRVEERVSPPGSSESVRGSYEAGG